jgi:hypothetical protein
MKLSNTGIISIVENVNILNIENVNISNIEK